MPLIQLDDEVLKNTGLDKFKDGDTVFAKMKLKMTDDGVEVDGIGDVTSKSGSANFINATTGQPHEIETSGELENPEESEAAPNPGEETGDESPSADVTSGDSEPMNPTDAGGSDESEADTRETKMLGYRRPKKPAFKAPNAFNIMENNPEY